MILKCVYHNTYGLQKVASLRNKNGIKESKAKPYDNQSGEKANDIS